MFYKNGIKIYFILFFLLNLNKCLYLQSGIKSLNKFLYYSRVSKYYYQNKKKTCSLSEGPNCYFTENDYAKHYIKTNNENKNVTINNEWVKLFSKIPKNKYKKMMLKLYNYTKNYIKIYSKEIDEEQNPQNIIFQVLVNFDVFDIDTIKHDIYLEEKMGKIIFNEEIIADIKGKLKLSYDNDKSEKEIRLKDKDYPATTYGTIESDYISISFGGKLFECNFLYLKAHGPKNEKNEILFYGYLGDRLMFSYNFIDQEKRKEKWIKVSFPEIISIDKLLILGYYDIDNLSFTFPNIFNFDQDEIYNMYNYKSFQILVSNDDI